MSLTLHKTQGVNPRMASCPRCGESNNELVLIGAHDKKFTCRACEAVSYGARACLKCKSTNGAVEQITEHEVIPTSLCDACDKEITEYKALVAAGGVYWNCDACTASGVIKAGAPIAQTVRTQLGVAAPDPCGITFDRNTCPACSTRN